MNRQSTTWHWDDVRFFLAVSRTGSLSGAARELRVGHVTVGRRIAALERRLGVKLLSRTPEGFSVTAAGQAVMKQCSVMESAALDLERVAAGRDAHAVGTVRITTTEALAHAVLAPAIAAVRRLHPQLQVDLAIGVRTLDMARREADVAVRFARPTAPGLVCRKLGDVAYSLYASRGYIARCGAPKRGGGLAGHDLITFTGAPAATSPFFLGESLAGARVALRCDSPLVQLRATERDVGISELACFLGDESDQVARVWPEESPAVRTAWLVIHEDLRRSARIRIIAAAIVEAFRRQESVLRRDLRGTGRKAPS
jgi:DNA-binding transcriptional LysR family regulator